MKLKVYFLMVFLTAITFGYEYFIFNAGLDSLPSILDYVKNNYPFYKNLDTDLSAGRPVSYMLGWTGFTIMCLTNLYILRKRFNFMGNTGTATGWLDFHIFCGLMGPLLIVFHTNFKVDGLVAISFWSMIVSLSSGVVGRYFYIQLLKNKNALDNEAIELKREFIGIRNSHDLNVDDDTLISSIERALKLSGAGNLISGKKSGILGAFWNSFWGDVKLRIFSLKIPELYPLESRKILRNYSITERRALFLDSFRDIMGYWHTFHLPFAVFMYLVALIHIVSALIFKVDHQI